MLRLRSAQAALKPMRITTVDQLQTINYRLQALTLPANEPAAKQYLKS